MVIQEDFSVHVRTVRKELVSYMKEARSRGQRAYLRFDKLYIERKPYTLEDLRNMNDFNQHTTSGQSPLQELQQSVTRSGSELDTLGPGAYKDTENSQNQSYLPSTRNTRLTAARARGQTPE